MALMERYRGSQLIKAGFIGVTLMILVIVAGLVTLRGEWKPLRELPAWSLTFLVLSGLATGLSWLCYYRALQMAPASMVAPIDKLSVALVIVRAVSATVNANCVRSPSLTMLLT